MVLTGKVQLPQTSLQIIQIRGLIVDQDGLVVVEGSATGVAVQGFGDAGCRALEHDVVHERFRESVHVVVFKGQGRVEKGSRGLSARDRNAAMLLA